MYLFYIRHGDPVYDPDSLTPLGREQANALAKRLCRYGIDEIYSSPSNRAVLTAKPTADLLRKEITTLDWCNESHAWNEFTQQCSDGHTCWLFSSWEHIRVMSSPEVLAMGNKWYEHPYFVNGEKHKQGIERITREARGFMSEQGFDFCEEDGLYHCRKPNGKRIALFAHEGFGTAFLPCLLNIPYPLFASHFCIGHSSMTVIEFSEVEASSARILTYSNDSHIYAEGLPTKFHNRVFY